MRKPVDIIFFLLILALLLISIIIANRPSPATEMSQLQAEVQSLRAEVEDVKRVQGWQSYYLEEARK